MKDIYKLKWTKLQLEIIRLLCIKKGEELSLRHISRLLEVSPTAVSKSIAKLEEENIIRKQIKNKAFSVEINDSKKAIQIKRIENIKIIYESGFIDTLEDNYPGNTIILFGSYSFGEDNIRSDIDLAIIGKEKTIQLKYFEEILERRININFYNSLADINKNLKESILNGIILKGSVEL
jgi:predicted nucleotidyltransferase